MANQEIHIPDDVQETADILRGREQTERRAKIYRYIAGAVGLAIGTAVLVAVDSRHPQTQQSTAVDSMAELAPLDTEECITLSPEEQSENPYCNQ